MQTLTIQDICVVVVTYNPNPDEVVANILLLVSNSISICIVDNSTDLNCSTKLSLLEQSNLHIITFNANLGIAKAQNVGSSWAFSSGYQAIVMVDQDSLITSTMIEALVKTYNELSASYKVACLGPIAYDKDKGESSQYNSVTLDANTQVAYKVETTLSSGMLIHKEALLQIGSMDEQLFIDLVDWEWCWRAKSKGYTVFVTPLVKMPHKLGEDRKSLGFSFSLGVPAPIRHYYQFRNYFLLLNREYVPFSFKIKYAIINTFKLFYYSTMLRPRIRRFQYSLKGIKDGVTMMLSNRNLDG